MVVSIHLHALPLKKLIQNIDNVAVEQNLKFQKHLTLLNVALRTHCDPLNATQVEDAFQHWSVVLVFWLVCAL